MPLTISIPELTDWLRLQATPGVGPETARKLLTIFGLPSNIFNASFTALNRFVSDRVASALLTELSSDASELIDKTILWCQEKDNYVLTLADVHYPKSLFTIPDPPMVLYAKGRVELLSQTAIAVVGSRHATQQGMTNANRFAEVLSQAGLTIVSGLAQGIDTAAHEGGLNGPSSTIAVIGTGADIVYPARNRALAHKIAEQGCILSEYSLGMPAIATNFPRRNRIISGLSRGVLLVEAALQSGSLITARMASEQGREVFAIPGSIHSPLAKGCHQLIKQGAKLVESAQDIIEELHIRSPLMKPEPTLSFEDETNLPHPILHAMGFDPIHIDTLAQRLVQDAASLNGELFALELDGLIERLPNGSYRRLY